MSKQHRPLLAALAFAAAGALTLSGCSSLNENPGNTGSSSGGGDDQITIGVVLSQTMVSRWLFDQKGIEDRADELGVELVMISADSDDQKQRAAVENMITREVDAIVIAPVNVDTAAATFKLAKDAGIPTVDYNFVAAEADFDYAVERLTREFGQAAAEAAVEQYPTGNYVIVGGDPASVAAIETTKGYMDVLQDKIDAGEITIVSEQYNPGWDPQSAQEQVEDALVAVDNDVVVVLSNNDGMAIGARTALDAQSLDKVYLSGVDADLANIKAIAAGKQSMTVWTDFELMGRNAIDAAYAAAMDEELDLPGIVDVEYAFGERPTIVMETILVTADNVCEWVREYEYYPPADVYGDALETECPA